MLQFMVCSDSQNALVILCNAVQYSVVPCMQWFLVCSGSCYAMVPSIKCLPVCTGYQYSVVPCICLSVSGAVLENYLVVDYFSPNSVAQSVSCPYTPCWSAALLKYAYVMFMMGIV